MNKEYKETAFYKKGTVLKKLGKAMQNEESTIDSLTSLALDAGLFPQFRLIPKEYEDD